MLKYLLTKQIQVKPITQDDNSFWGVFEITPLESFFDDLYRYGIVTALENAHIDYLINRIETKYL
jgi:hypothetical protein